MPKFKPKMGVARRKKKVVISPPPSSSSSSKASTASKRERKKPRQQKSRNRNYGTQESHVVLGSGGASITSSSSQRAKSKRKKSSSSSKQAKKATSSKLVKKEHKDQLDVMDIDDDKEKREELSEEEEQVDVLLPPGKGVPVTLPYSNGAERWNTHDRDDEDIMEVDKCALKELFGKENAKLKEELLFIQLPAQLPVPESKAIEHQSDGLAPTNGAQTPRTAKLSNSYSGNEPPYFTPGIPNVLKTMRDGPIGKLRIHQSGKVTLNMNGLVFDLNDGVACHFRQQAVSVNYEADKKDDDGGSSDSEENDFEGKFIPLGDVKRRLIATPNIETLLSMM
eukprot:g213.t1